MVIKFPSGGPRDGLTEPEILDRATPLSHPRGCTPLTGGGWLDAWPTPDADGKLGICEPEGSVYPDQAKLGPAIVEEETLAKWEVSTSPTSERDHEVNEITGEPKWGIEMRRIRESKQRDPDHPDQQALDAYATEDTTPSRSTPDVDVDTVEHDPRLDGLPVFLDEADIPTVAETDPTRSGPANCNHCGAHMPWDEPLERGIRGVRSGGLDGNPQYEHCNPAVTNIRSCDCCGCPQCAAKSIRHRKTKDPSFACNNTDNCGVEFEYPIERPSEIRDNRMHDQRDRLYWTCRSCGEPTQAPFPGVPEDML